MNIEYVTIYVTLFFIIHLRGVVFPLLMLNDLFRWLKALPAIDGRRFLPFSLAADFSIFWALPFVFGEYVRLSSMSVDPITVEPPIFELSDSVDVLCL